MLRWAIPSAPVVALVMLGWWTAPAPDAAAAAAAQEPAPAIGVYGRLRTRTGADLTAAIFRLRATGATFSREDFSWAAIERRPGTYDWRTTDALVAAAARQRLAIMPLIGGSPPHVARAWNVPPAPGAGYLRFAAFVRAVVARYGSRGAFWRARPDLPGHPMRWFDLWNEPYFPGSWAPRPDPVAYAQMFITAVIAARTADPQARFLLEVNTSAFNPGAPSYLLAMVRAVPGLARYADGVSVHPYASNGWSPARCSRYVPSRGVAADWRSTLYQTCRVEDVRRILDAHGMSRTRLWITEIGWTTASGAAGAVTEAVQARYVGELFGLLRGRWRGIVDGVQWYALQDRLGPGGVAEGHGLLRRDGSPKPAWQPFARAAAGG